MMTGIEMRVLQSQNFIVKKYKLTNSSPKKLRILIFEGRKLKTAGNMHFNQDQRFQSVFWTF